MISFKLKNFTSFLIFVVLVTIIKGQRPSFAGSLQHSGYKDKFRPESNDSTLPDELSNRFGQDLLSNQTQRPPVFINVVQPEPEFSAVLGERFDDNTNATLNSTQPINLNPNQLQPLYPETTTRLPYDALGNKDIVDRLNRLPQDQRPFWLINAPAIEASRNRTNIPLISPNQDAILTQQEDQSFSGNNSQLNQGNVIRGPIILQALLSPVESRSSLVLETPVSNNADKIVQTTPAGAVSGDSLIDFVDVTTVEPELSEISTIEPGESLIDIDDETTAEPELSEISTIQPNSAGFPNYGKIKP